MPDTVQWIFRALSIACALAILILLPMVGKLHIKSEREKRKWRKIPSGTILSLKETGEGDIENSSPAQISRKEVKKL